MADFEIERPSVDVQPIQPTYNINTPSFTIEINGSTPGQRGEQGPPGQDGRDGIDGTNGIDGQDGVGVESIEQTSTSHESGGTNIITATLTDGSQSFFEIMNGEAGSGGGMETLESPIILQELEDGFYRVPANTNVYGVEETEFDIQFTTNCSALLCITHEEVVDGDEPSTTYDLVSYYSIEDNGAYTSPSSFAIDPDCNVKIIYGAVCDDTGDEWTGGEISLKDLLKKTDVVNNLTSTSTTRPLSAAQGKALKDLLDAIVIPTNTSDLNNDSGFISSESDPVFSASVAAGISSSDISNWNGKSNFSGDYTDLTNKPTIPDELSDLSDDSTHRLVTDTEKTTWNNKSDFSGSYNDLTNKPTIPNKTSQLTNDSNFVTSTNISDNIKASGYTTKTDPNLGTIEIVNYAKRYGGSNYAYLDSKTVAHTVNSVTNTLDNVINGKQETLVSGTNIKTINNQSLLGSGNIDVSGGGGTPTDVQINGTSITSNNVADIITETAYDSSTNKIATMSDIPDTSDFIDKDVNNLTNYSLTTDIQNNKSLAKGIEYIVGTQAAATNLWTGTSTDTGCSSGTLYTGKVIIYHLPQAGSSTAATLNLTLPDGTTTGAKNVYRLATTTTTTNFAAGCDILMVYDGTNWKVNAYVDTSGSNTIGYQLRTNYGVYYNGASTSIYRYQLLVETKNGLEPFTSTSNKTGTTKTQLDPHYIPGGDIRYYSSTTEITAGSEIGKTSIWQQYQFDLRYSFNITSTTLTSGKPVYMKMSRNNDGTLSAVYSSASGGHPITQTLPTTEDNYIYMFLGEAYNGYQIELNVRHPLYEFKNGRLREYVDASGGTITETDPVFTSSAAYGISSSDITTWNNKSDFSGNYNDLTNKPTIPTVPTTVSSFTNDAGYITGYTETDPVFVASAAHGITSTDITNWNNKSTFSGNYNDLTNKPTIPTVNNATLTIQKNGTTVDTFTANASSNVTANITVPTSTSDLTNNSGYITSADLPISASEAEDMLWWSTVTTVGDSDYFVVSEPFRLGDLSLDTFISSESIKHYQNGDYNSLSTVLNNKQDKITSTNKLDYSLLSNTPTIPTQTSQLTNNSGFITNSVNNLTNYTLTSSLATVATSGNYNDLSNKPTIPTITLSTTTWIDSLF